jgi:hypothetical protein
MDEDQYDVQDQQEELEEAKEQQKKQSKNKGGRTNPVADYAKRGLRNAVRKAGWKMSQWAANTAVPAVGNAIGGAVSGATGLFGGATSQVLAALAVAGGAFLIVMTWAAVLILTTFFVISAIFLVIQNGAYIVPPDKTLVSDEEIAEGTPPRPLPPGGQAGKCGDEEEITPRLASQIPSASVRLLPDYLGARSEPGRMCFTPKMLIMHWSAGGNDNPDGNLRTYTTLVSRDRACQLGVDPNDVEFWQPFYETQVEMAWCSNSWNAYGIANEMSGNSFGANPPPPNLNELELTYAASCVLMQQYHIPWCQIYGHYHVPDSGGKVDPGREFLEQVFIPGIRARCPNDPSNICGG